MMTLGGDIADWKIVNQGDNFTVLGFTKDGRIVYWKEGKWNEL